MLTGALTTYWIRSAPPPALTFESPSSDRKVRTRNLSSPALPLTFRTAMLRKIEKKSLPLPPLIVVSKVTPFVSSPRVVSRTHGRLGRVGRREGAPELTDLEEVVALAAVDRRLRGVVVEREAIVAAERVDQQAVAPYSAVVAGLDEPV